MADFNYPSKYNKEANFSRVKFGADAPLLETELNEMQEIQEGKLTEVVRTLLPDSLISGSFSYSNGRLTITDVIAVVKGRIINIPWGDLAVTSSSSVYIRVYTKDATYESTLKNNGFEGGSVIANQMLDARIGYETSRRVVIASAYTTDTSLSGDYLYLGKMIGAGFSEEVERAPIVTPTDKRYWDKKAQYGDIDVQTGEYIKSTKSENALIDITELKGKTYQKVTTQGKNLFDYNQIRETTTTTAGTSVFTITNNKDGSFTLNGTAPYISYTNYSYATLQAGTYIKSCKPRECFVVRYKNDEGTYVYPSLTYFTLTKPTQVEMYIQTNEGSVWSNEKVYPQLEAGTSATTWEAFVPNSPSLDYSSPILSSGKYISSDNYYDITLMTTGKNISSRTGYDNNLNGTTIREVFLDPDITLKAGVTYTISYEYLITSYTGTTLEPLIRPKLYQVSSALYDPSAL